MLAGGGLSTQPTEIPQVLATATPEAVKKVVSEVASGKWNFAWWGWIIIGLLLIAIVWFIFFRKRVK